MALVLALAGSALLYTGCTKDYNEDINNLAGQINDLKSLHATDIANLQSALSNLESSLKSADAAIEAGYKAADAALQADLDAAKGRISANENAINGLKGDVKDLQDADADLQKAIDANAKDIESLVEDLNKAVTDLNKSISDLAGKVEKDLAGLETKLTGAFQTADANLQQQIDANLADAKNSLDEAKKLLLNELRSIVFMPELYYAGIEATEYVWTNYYRQAMVKADGKTSFQYKGVQFKFAENAEIYAENAADDKGIVLDPVALSQLATAQYELNPSSFDVAKAAWELDGTDYRYLVRGEAAEEELAWHPVYKEGSIVNEGGVATIRYSIENPWLLPTSVYANAEEIDWPTFEMDQIETVLEDNDLEELAQDGPIYDFFKKSWDEILKAITSIPTQGGPRFFDESKLAKYLHDLNAEVDNLGKKVENYAKQQRKDEATIRTVKSDVMRLAMQFGMQQVQIARLYVLATQNYEGTGYVPVMNLTATLDGGRKIASDYEAIVSTDEEFAALAFDAATDYQTAFKGCSKGEHLYTSAYGAIGNKASVAAAYDKPLDLDFIKIHMWDARNGESVKSLEELQKVYPKLNLTYELVSYYAGENETAEDKYGMIKDGKFYAMAVDDEGNQIDTYGASSVGKTPVVLVKLFNGEDLVLAGYYKIQIVKEISTTVINLRDFGTVPYICSYDALKTTWSQFSAKILDALDITYESFQKNYEIDCRNYGPVWFRDRNNYDAVVYVKDKDGNYVASNKFGAVKYIVDNNGGVVNDRFEWTLPADTKYTDNLEPGTYTVYVKFNDGEYKVVYVALTVTVAEAASFDFGANKITNEWYTDINDEAANTVKVNVHVPVKPADEFNYVTDDGRVMEYYRDLDHYFVNYKPSRVLAEGVDPVYNEKDGENLKWASALKTQYVYSFSVDQPKVGKYQLGLLKDAEGKVLDYNTLYAFLEDSDPAVVATLTPAGAEPEETDYNDNRMDLLTYAVNDVTKEILNLYKFDATDPAEKVYANIHVDVKYGTCGIAAGEEDFHARFLRPLAIDWKDPQEIQESGVGGDNIVIANYLKDIIDWNNQKVIVADDKDTVAPYKENQISTINGPVNMYKYYGFKTLTVDLANAQRDCWNADATKKGKVSDITPKAKLEAYKFTVDATTKAKTYTKIDPVEGKISLDIENFKDLYYNVINYQNDEAAVEVFNLYFPVTVEYAWGKINGTLVVKVNKTGNVE